MKPRLEKETLHNLSALFFQAICTVYVAVILKDLGFLRHKISLKNNLRSNFRE